MLLTGRLRALYVFFILDDRLVKLMSVESPLKKLVRLLHPAHVTFPLPLPERFDNILDDVAFVVLRAELVTDCWEEDQREVEG